jgi:N-methylhydantoinase B/oxoprolinase/acetone carboxylase alpha subunit
VIRDAGAAPFVSDFLEEMHHRQGVWDLASGAPGTTGRDRARRRRETHALVSDLVLGKGDVVRIVTAQGRGWGEAPQPPPDGKSFG